MKEQFFHGVGRKYPYFEGWYLKHQNMRKTIAFIPAVHADKDGKWTASIQVVMDEGAWNFNYPIEMCKIQRDRFRVKIGENIFSEKGIRVNIQVEDLSIQGKIMYAGLQKIKTDIMGPFRFFPFMQCNHGVISMAHELRGKLEVNGEIIEFTGGRGYIETDWGESFPESYLWSQCGFGGGGRNSIMASVADIPFLGGQFRGCICAAHYEGREYRMGTYYGARIKEYGDGFVTLKQGRMRLRITRLSERSFELKAPVKGGMERKIKESPSCRVQYQLWNGNHQIFNLLSDQASFEQEL